jgi:hypothetical protein
MFEDPSKAQRSYILDLLKQKHSRLTKNVIGTRQSSSENSTATTYIPIQNFFLQLVDHIQTFSLPLSRVPIRTVKTFLINFIVYILHKLVKPDHD